MTYSYAQVTSILNKELVASGSTPISDTTLKNRWFGGNMTVSSKLPDALIDALKSNGKFSEVGLSVAQTYLDVHTGKTTLPVWLKSLSLSYPEYFQPTDNNVPSVPDSLTGSEMVILEAEPVYQVGAIAVYENPFSVGSYTTNQSNLSTAQTISNSQQFNSDLAAFIKAKTVNKGDELGSFIAAQIIERAELVKQHNLGEYVKNSL